MLLQGICPCPAHPCVCQACTAPFTHVCRSARLCHPLTSRTRFLQQCKPLLSHPGQCACCFTPRQALALPCNHHWLQWADLPPTPGCSLAPAMAPSLHLPTLLTLSLHPQPAALTTVNPTWPPQLPHPNPLSRTLMVLDETMGAGRILALLGIQICQCLQSLCPYGWCIFTLRVPARRGCRAGCRSLEGKRLWLQRDSVPSTFPEGAMGLFNQTVMAGMGGKSLGMEC